MNDDERWFEALAGRAGGQGSGNGSAEAAFEARLLRAALRQADPLPQPSPTAADRQRLVAALRRQRSGWRCGGCARRWQAWLAGWPRAGWSAAVAALTAAVVAGTTLLLWPHAAPPERAESTLRGAATQQPHLIRAAAPAEQRNALATQLTAQGAKVRRYERLGRFGLDAQLPRPQSATLLSLLGAAGLPAPADGVLRVEFETGTP